MPSSGMIIKINLLIQKLLRGADTWT